MGPRSALITGAAGQDGSYLCERLLADGYAVWGLVRDGDSRTDIPTGVRTVVADLRDAARMKSVLEETAPDEVYNLGGLSSVAASWRDPEGTLAVNATAATSLMAACARQQESTGRPVRFLQAASAEIFGEPAHSPQNEDTPIAPVSPYGESKAIAHEAALKWSQHGLFACSLILYNHESPRRPATFVTRKITQAAARIAQGAQEELVLGNLAARRDWGWAPDYVAAMVLAMRHPTPTAYVVATGQTHSVADFVEAAMTAAGVSDWDRRVRSDPAFFVPADPTEQRGDASRARAELSWAPSVDFTGLVSEMVRADLELATR